MSSYERHCLYVGTKTSPFLWEEGMILPRCLLDWITLCSGLLQQRCMIVCWDDLLKLQTTHQLCLSQDLLSPMTSGHFHSSASTLLGQMKPLALLAPSLLIDLIHFLFWLQSSLPAHSEGRTSGGLRDGWESARKRPRAFLAASSTELMPCYSLNTHAVSPFDTHRSLVSGMCCVMSGRAQRWFSKAAVLKIK